MPRDRRGTATKKDIQVSEYLFEMRNIVKEFSGVRALNGIDLAVRPVNASAFVARTAQASPPS